MLQSMGSQKSWTQMSDSTELIHFHLTYVYTHIGILFNFKQERNLAISDNMDESGEHYAK